MNVMELWSRQRGIRWNTQLSAAAILALAGMALPAGAATPEAGYQEAQRIFLRGDVVGAMPLLRSAADAGYAPAQVLLAEILDKAEFDSEAVEYFRKAAQQGNADGEFRLAGMYASGEGVARSAQEALRWYRLAAGHGHDRAILVLARAHLHGGLGLTDRHRDDLQARRWIRISAEKGDVRAMEGLAAALRNGDFGFAVDPSQAADWEAKIKKLRVPASRERRK